MKATPLTEESYQYIVDRFAQSEAELLRPMRARAEAAGMPMIMISEDQAKFVGFFLKAIKAKRVLDVGTLFGFSAAIMARAIGGNGEVVSLEFEELHARIAQENWEDADIKNIRCLQGPALVQMKKFESDSFDFILIDADKVNYVNYLNEALRLVKNGGVIAGDNALAWGKITNNTLSKDDPDYLSVTSVQAFNEAFSAENRLFGVIIPIGDGMAMGVVQK